MFTPLTDTLPNHATADLPLLFEYRGVSYHRLDLVIQRVDGRYAGIYTLYRDWDKSAAGELSNREQIIEMQLDTIRQLSEGMAAAQTAKDEAERSAQSAKLVITPLHETIAAIRDENERLRALRDATPVEPPAPKPAPATAAEFEQIRKLERALQDANRLVAAQQRDLDAARTLASELATQRDTLLAAQPTPAPIPFVLPDTQPTMPEQTTHICSKCKQLKQLATDFYLRDVGGGRMRLSRSECKDCTNHGPTDRPPVDGELDCPECAALGMRPKKPITTQAGMRAHRQRIHHTPADVILRQEIHEVAA